MMITMTIMIIMMIEFERMWRGINCLAESEEIFTSYETVYLEVD